MAHTYEELKKKTIAELRDIAKDIQHEAVQGYTQLNKDHLLPALCKALGIDSHAHHAAAIAEKGYATVTIADVVGHARVSKRTFYEHFADKEACFLALYSETSDELLDLIAEAAASAGGAVQPTLNEPIRRPPLSSGTAAQAWTPVVATSAASSGEKASLLARSASSTRSPVRAATQPG